MSSMPKKRRSVRAEKEPLPPTLEDALECIICLDVPASPIHNCANGHIICGICVEKVNKCGLCESADLQVSILGERISRQFGFKLKCPYFEVGCKKIIPAAEGKLHKENCYFRDIACIEWGEVKCHGAKIAMNEYATHLQEQHKWSTWSGRKARISYKNGALKGGLSWPLDVLTKDGKTFLRHSHTGADQSVYFWVTILGSKEEAEKYSYELKVSKSIEDDDRKVEIAMSMPVVAFHDRQKYVEGLPYYASMTVKKLLEFCTRCDEGGDDSKYEFTWSWRVL